MWKKVEETSSFLGDHLYGGLLTGDADLTAFAGDLPVRVNPERHSSFDGQLLRFICGDSVKAIVLSAKSGGQGKQNEELGQIAHGAQIQDPVA